MKILLRIADIILNLLFPLRCGFCSEIIPCIQATRYPLCEKCLSKIKFIGQNACAYCGKELNDGEKNICKYCKGARYYEKVISVCEYSGLAREKILEFKFMGKKELYKVFSILIIEKLKMTNFRNFDIIISVPIHSSKLAERGYNQSELIAREIAKYFGLPVSSSNLIKDKQTESQSLLDKTKRIMNVLDSFRVQDKREIKGKKVLLVDDIITTGATVNECSKVLKQAGGLEVYVVTIATGRSDVNRGDCNGC